MDRNELGSKLNLKVEMIPEGNENRSGRQIAPDYITIHNTSNANPGADANAHSRFVRNKGYYVLSSGKKNYVSWHYTVDDKRVIKHLPVHERAIHAGSGNGKSIAIEICMHKEIDQEAANLRAKRLVAVLMHDLKIRKENIKPHKHWTKKPCPKLLLPIFDSFVSDCDAVCKSILTSSGSGLAVGNEEVDLVEALRLDPPASTLGEEESEDVDHDEEHDLIAAEVKAYIE